MKLAHLIFATVIALTAFYIQIDNPSKVIHLYISTLAFCFTFGIYKNEPNIYHISIILFLIAISEHLIFSYGLVNLGKNNDNYLVVGTVVFGIQLLINLFAIILFIFRVQISRLFSSSSKIILTDFDGLFHWVFIAASFMNILALIENALRNGLGWLSLTFFYDIYPTFGYALIAVTCGLLLTMVIIQLKNKQLT
ncbi:hypothetical protein [Pseudoalteromonas luteoviolacea]|uniref:Uncharacterized protein n=1 Tax=Pseudoalteromonas luteoviolacea S4054 TaxID=1129367 RepID=A0A0F6AF87_9GAMM|nr:hypothetical protein [Pseudoalteromonas luteoviolacea]AOT10048.1 hypothetical protein S4054249_20510 [Pseudoalteromonas luteoviolacea]AOT14960.1 hypothetical protein S40542_20480 [Pseudoalteromonas luteoviolacea]AOT19876.1 hypothetical protein S4054_20485 [Pseudoalteromonas luteoviolacea]KKE84865.1 hypothetical protein N479_07145 [Pseudoalteromonas luteoviolacea S4054]KZN72482.1 hypothetical protein N481_14735 [Pseudoalteromonas luteoviolacea S4047-1]